MKYHELESLRQTHPAWRLLRADHVSFIVGFLHATFVAPNRRAVVQQELASRLDDYIFHLRESSGAGVFPQAASAYLDAWAAPESGWLRKYYQADSDEPHFDMTPGAAQAVDWITSLERRQFVGTESRLMTVFELLRQVVEGTQSDPDVRVADLEKRKAAIDDEIARIRGGHIALMDASQVKDRFMQVESTARQLLSDFRQVEQNFRRLDRSARERIAMWESGKGALLHEIFGDRDAITDSDQGKSFRAFWDFLMSPQRQEELSDLLARVFALGAVQELGPDKRFLRVHYDWLEAGEVAQRTIAKLSEQLRRLLDDRILLENRRILEIIRAIEQHAIATRDEQPRAAAFMELDDVSPTIALAMDRPLFRPPTKVQLTDIALIQGDGAAPDGALFDQFYVDRARLESQIRQGLQMRDQVSLAELLLEYPLEHGLAELIAYLTIATETDASMIDEAQKQQVEWTDGNGTGRRASIPLVTFTR